MAPFLFPEQFQRIFEATPGAFLLLRPDPAFTIIGASDAYLQATLRQRAEVMGRPLFEVFPDNPQTPDANSTLNLSRSLDRVIATRQPDVMAVQRYDVPTACGGAFELRYWSPVNAPVFAEDGTILCIVHRVDNVTDYVRLAEDHARQRSVTERLSADKVKMEAEIVERSLELDRLNRDLRDANRELSEYAARTVDAARNKDEFLAMLAHELRNPLSAMSSALQLAAITPPDEPRYPGLLDVCRRQVKNLTRLVDDLLEMSRMDRGAVELQRGPLDLRDLIENALHATRELFERRGLTISARIAPANFGAFGDATRLEQALTNLLTNAAKYSEPGGNVELRLEPAAGQERWARLEVRDEGRGIPPEKLDAIFDIFVQVDPGIDRSLGGLGIGLALVRSIVGLHGGRVRAHSEGIGQGSRFVIELPLASLAELERHETHAPSAAGPAAPAGATPNRILIVEDNADARETLLALLTAFGYPVSAAATGREGLDRLIATRPDIAIIDIGLPELDGFELARRAREAVGRATRLVALTGYNTPVVRAAALDAGFDMYVTKPCTPARLAEILAAPGPGRS